MKEGGDVKEEKLLIEAGDGVEIPLWLYLPDQPKSVIQFNPGTAAKMRFYQPFLRFLAQRGFAVGQLGYRGSAEGPATNLKDCGFGYADYGLLDIPAGRAYLQQKFPGLPFLFVGHSGGGQQLPFCENLKDVAGAHFFGVSTGYAPGMPLHYRLQSHFFFYLFGPLSIALKGYVAAKRFGIMEDLPPKAFNDWKDWCTSPDYFFDPRFYGTTVPEVDFGRIDFPIHHCHASDETISTSENVRTFWRHWSSKAGITQQLLRPADYSVKEIVHFGYFRRKMKDTLWVEVAERLESWVENKKGRA
ncbi:alpha/beta hydrolase family protein [Neolewinella agarilytica]|uniref:Predicted alpha/beta hydrolase n=1 Tax=Neolewinella agarilytica TaxID=478744 RepID=A0A1H9AGN6_9BACT|nr:hypothetical protein [Neolewinella agarilytica]SEP75896.1 Predicted alpha/beta hydrolase [Neolewinella agarilytica]